MNKRDYANAYRANINEFLQQRGYTLTPKMLQAEVQNCLDNGYGTIKAAGVIIERIESRQVRV